MYMCVYMYVTGCLRETLKPPGGAGRGATGHRRTHRTLPAQLGESRAGPPWAQQSPSRTGAAAGRRWSRLPRGPYVMEWFQNTQTGLVRSSVSRRTCSTRTGLSRGLGSGAPSLYTTALTTGVLMTGRLGSLRGEAQLSTHLRATLVSAAGPVGRARSELQPGPGEGAAGRGLGEG